MPYPPPPACLAQRDLRSESLQDIDQALLRCYTWMYLARRADDRILELFRQGKIRGTVAGGQGNEALVVPLTLLADKENDVVCFSHRCLGGHLIWSGELGDHISQYLANAGSPTRAREGNVHHGDPANRSLPMISHLGAMLSNVLGAADSQRRLGRPAVGFTFFGDGASSTGDIHECLNLASLFSLPVVFVIENNQFAYSTPTSEQYAHAELVERAGGYGMEGIAIDATDPETVLRSLAPAIERVRASGRPILVEAHTLRLRGHAAYDTGDYLPAGLAESWEKKDPLPRLRARLAENCFRKQLESLEAELDQFFEASLAAALQHPPPDPEGLAQSVYAPTRLDISWTAEPAAEPLTLAQALQRAHRKILRECPQSLILGQDIATYGGPFKVTEDLFTEFGRARVVNTPLAESACTGYATGLALGGHRPIVEFQFADFSTEAVTQITLNAATYHFRSGAAIPLVFRLPCGGGLTFGSFHSQELESLFLSMPGLKALYPSNPQDAFNALLAAFEDDNPVLLFEHKRLYRYAGRHRPHGKQAVGFDPNYRDVWNPQRLRQGDFATLVTYGEMVYVAEEAADYFASEYEIGFDLFDLRALAPLNLESVAESVARTHRLIVLHEGRLSHGFGAELVARLTERLFFELEAPPLRIASLDTPVPFAPELEQAYRPTVNSVIARIADWIG